MIKADLQSALGFGIANPVYLKFDISLLRKVKSKNSKVKKLSRGYVMASMINSSLAIINSIKLLFPLGG
ncbi:hypothetical protein C4F49_11715 [Sphingobacterium sp. KB22]|uniref:Uncharacterized protein n=1 Tax=Sphingobacterium hungaricum TaxID=2082723 RepID=A0A928UZR4_9SPHI|nr:hypothetical protein [Sphingobacterium hungaricum]